MRCRGPLALFSADAMIAPPTRVIVYNTRSFNVASDAKGAVNAGRNLEIIPGFPRHPAVTAPKAPCLLRRRNKRFADQYHSARARSNMDFDSCYNCGQQGHFASSCPLGLDPTPKSTFTRWKPPPRRPADEQAAINERGIALCRMALAKRGSV